MENGAILIVDDDQLSAMLLERILCRSGYSCIVTHSGKDAVEICRSNSDIKLILMDLKMPFMNGFEATRQIRLFNKIVEIVAQSAFPEHECKQEALDVGCNDYMSKPIDHQILNDVLEKVLN